MIKNYDSKWGCAAKEGLILAAVTVVCTLLAGLVKSNVINSILSIVKLVGSIWVLRVIMLNYGKARPSESTFSYGFMVCLCSALVCTVWTFVMTEFIFPDTFSNALAQVQSAFEEMDMELPDNYEESLTMVEENYGKIVSIGMFFWCSFLGLVLSGILAPGTSRNRNIFADEQDEENEE